VADDANLGKSINQIEIFDTLVAFLAGVMIIPAVFTFMGREGMEASGPSLMFVSLPKVFAAMGSAGNVIGCMFFAMVLFAALTSAVSVMEAVVSSFMDEFHISRIKAAVIETVIALAGGAFLYAWATTSCILISCFQTARMHRFWILWIISATMR